MLAPSSRRYHVTVASRPSRRAVFGWYPSRSDKNVVLAVRSCSKGRSGSAPYAGMMPPPMISEI